MRTWMIGGAFLASVGAASANDLGTQLQDLLAAQSATLFGISAPLAASASPSPTTGYRKAADTPADVISLAPGLTARFVTRNAANSVDQLTLFPASSPTHLFACVEVSRAVIGLNGAGADKYNPSVQRITIATGAVETVVRGMNRCDGVRVTPWNTIIANEEDPSGGRLYEILDPLVTAEVTILDRATGLTSAPDKVAQRTALPKIAWEGMEILPNGVVYAGDELRPGTSANDADGGTVYKFIPTTPYVKGTVVATLAESPLTAGTNYALRVSCESTTVGYGQGCETGGADWVQIDPANARLDAEANGATGFFRPEDMTRDKTFTSTGAKVCFTATGGTSAKNYAEVICVADKSPTTAPTPSGTGKITHTTEVQRFVVGGTTFNSFDNVDFQAVRNNLHIVEDAANGDALACLRDGPDQDLLSDGCIRWASVKDSSAEPSGILFNSFGKKAYLSLSHSNDNDPSLALFDGYRTDDILEITGFK